MCQSRLRARGFLPDWHRDPGQAVSMGCLIQESAEVSTRVAHEIRNVITGNDVLVLDGDVSSKASRITDRPSFLSWIPFPDQVN